MRSNAYLSLVLSAATLLGGCWWGDDKAPPPAASTGLLVGAGPTALATSATVDEYKPWADSPRIVDVAGHSSEVREAIVRVSAEATVEQVNAALVEAGGKIIGMRTGSQTLIVGFENETTAHGLIARLNTLNKSAAIELALPSLVAIPNALPDNPWFGSPKKPDFLEDQPAQIALSKFIDHHLAVRAYAAWNLSGLLDDPDLASKRPVMIYQDAFADDPPGYSFVDGSWQKNDFAPAWLVNITPDDFLDRKGTKPENWHGYGVMSIVSGHGAKAVSGPNYIEGLYPRTLESRVSNEAWVSAGMANQKTQSLINAYRNPPGGSAPRNVIVSSSTNVCDAICGIRGAFRIIGGKELEDQRLVDIQHFRKSAAALLAGDYIENVRRSLLDANGDPQFLHVYASGNVPDKWASVGDNGYADSDVDIDPADLFSVGLSLSGELMRIRLSKAAKGKDFNELEKGDLERVLDSKGIQVTVPKLPHLIAVESRGREHTKLHTFLGDPTRGIAPETRYVPPTVGCHRTSTSPHGRISGIGGEVDLHVFADPTASPKVSSGSSFAAPQVSAAAAWVWSLDPSLSPVDVKQILTRTSLASPWPCGDERDFAASVDLYAAVLATDNPYGWISGDPRNRDLGSTTKARVRRYLLDVASADRNTGELKNERDGHFTQADIMMFLKEIWRERAPEPPDYSRFDLNGNGTIHGNRFKQDLVGYTRFDLNGDFQWATAERPVENLRLTFNEDVTHDLDILIYYAYSDLYEGSEYERAMLLLPYVNLLSGRAISDFNGFAVHVNSPQVAQFTSDILMLEAADGLGVNVFKGGYRCPVGSAEWGSPKFSEALLGEGARRSIDTPLVMWTPSVQDGLIAGSPRNAVDCSSFVASYATSGLVWIVSASRSLSGNDLGAGTEYQTRTFLGEPDLLAPQAFALVPSTKRLATQKLSYGTIAGKSGQFEIAWETQDFQVNGISLRAR